MGEFMKENDYLEVRETETIDYWPTAIYEGNDSTVSNPVGVQNVFVSKDTYEDDSVKFSVHLETISEITSWNKGQEAVLEAIVNNPTYDSGDMELQETFATESEAVEFAEKNFPFEFLEQAIKFHYMEDEGQEEDLDFARDML